MLLQPVEQRLREVECLLAACGLQREVYLAVGAYAGDVSLHAVARLHVLEYLVAVDEAGILVVDDDLEAQIGLLPYHDVYLVAGVVCGLFLVEVFLHLRRSHNAVALFVDGHIDDVRRTYLHAAFLFAEGAEEVFHQAPVEEGAVFVHPRALEVGKVARLSQRVLGGSHEAFVLVEVQKHVEFVTYLIIFGYIALGQQYLALIASVEVESEVYLFHYFQQVICSQLYLLHCLLDFVFRCG